MQTTTNIVYAHTPNTDSRLQSLDIYAPNTPEPSPLMVWIHGGGWMASDKQKDVEHKARFFTQLGYLFVSVNYRLSPKVQHPAHTQDAAQSIHWLHQNAADYGGDPHKMALMGHSSGGHIVALLGSNARFLLQAGLDPKIIRGVLVIDGVGFNVQSRMSHQNRSFSRMYAQAFGSNEADWIDASPILHVGDFTYTPPYLMLCADYRPQAPVAAQAFLEALHQANLLGEVITIPDKDHGSINEDIGKPEETINGHIERFLRESFS